MFIQTEPTPNPNALKFIPGREGAPGTSIEYRTIEEAAASPLAEALFELEGVDGVFFGEDYVSVTRHERGPGWGDMKASILSVIMDHFVSGAPLLRYEAKPEGHAEQEDDEIILEIKNLLDSRIRPAVAQDGGDILFDSFDHETGIVRLRMRGACSGCPSSSATLKSGVEQMLRHYVPEVNAVEQVL